MIRAVLVIGLLVSPAAMAEPVHYVLPDETAELAPGQNAELAQSTCGACHSADYITTQPRGLSNPTAFWTGEVIKMRNVYKAQISDDDARQIAAYLADTYGK